MSIKIYGNGGGSVELVADPTLATDEVVEIDATGNSGIESGSNTNGEWTKFPDGTMICSMRIEVTDQAIDSAYGSLFTGDREWTFPNTADPFITPPSVTSGIFKWGTGASWGAINSPISEFRVGIRGIDIQSRASGTITKISAQAMGRWK